MTLSQYLHWYNTVQIIILSHPHLCRKTRSYLLLLLLYLCPHHSGPCCCFCSVAQSCLIFCDPMEFSTPGFPVLHFPRDCSNACPLSEWCHPTISSSVVPFSSCLQSFPASGSFLMSQLFASGGQNIGASASASVLPTNIQGLISFRMDWLDLLTVQGTLKSLLQHHISTHEFFSAQLSLWSNTLIYTWYWKNHSFDYTDLLSAR